MVTVRTCITTIDVYYQRHVWVEERFFCCDCVCVQATCSLSEKIPRVFVYIFVNVFASLLFITCTALTNTTNS